MQKMHSIRKPRLQIRCKKTSKIHSCQSEPPDQSFWISSSLRIAGSEGIQGLNTNRFLAGPLDISDFNFVDFLVSQHCRCIILVPLGTGVIGPDR